MVLSVRLVLTVDLTDELETIHKETLCIVLMAQVVLVDHIMNIVCFNFDVLLASVDRDLLIMRFIHRLVELSSAHHSTTDYAKLRKMTVFDYMPFSAIYCNSYLSASRISECYDGSLVLP